MSLRSIFTKAPKTQALGLGRAIRAGLLLLTSLVYMPDPANAQTLFEQLIMPGDLSSVHAKFEKTCETCHESFAQSTQPQLCLDCHKPVALDVANKTGYHGRSPEAAALTCSDCHTDHQGRDAQITRFDRQTFDHRQTDFPLDKGHEAVRCEGCHMAGKRLAEAPSACIDCHGANDPHKGGLGRDCASCHVSTKWVEVRAFDHAKTGFVLNGKHAEAGCLTCHRTQVWKGLPKTCIGCHALDDNHEGSMGQDCAKCHVEADWKQVKFNHDRDTKFALVGPHAKVDCAGCHQAGMGPTSPVKPAMDCATCHDRDDPHKGALGHDCANCHKVDGWRTQVRFDHDLTNFPLIGLHSTALCESCHKDQGFQIAKLDCASCHMADDSHKGALGPDCGTCHTPNGWALWRFDHDVATDFDLTGAHRGLTCKACHAPQTVASKVATDCLSCHKPDDIHKGAFGADCAVCHGTDTFKGAKLKLPIPAPKP